MKDPIVEEVEKIKEEIAREFNYDIDALFKHLMKEQKKGKHKLIPAPPKKSAG